MTCLDSLAMVRGSTERDTLTLAELSIRPELIHSLVPRHTVKQLWETGRIDVDAFEAVMLSVLEL